MRGSIHTFCLGGLGFLFLACAAFAADPDPVPDSRPSMEMAIRLFYGTNTKTQEADPEMAKLVDTLKKDFGYLHYDLKKSEHVTLKFDQTATKDLGDEMIFIVRNLGVFKEQRKVWLELWFRGKKVAGAFSLFPKPCNPVLIKGPNTDDGTYIIVLSLINGEAK